jgi:hypothetical protein
MKTVLLATAAVLALSAGSVASAAGSHPAMAVTGGKISPIVGHDPSNVVLWNQNSNSNGEGIDSQNFSSTFQQYDTQSADDFVVPAGAVWKIKEVDVTGLYFGGSGPATSEEVIIWKKAKGMPSQTRLFDVNNIKGADSAGSFVIKIPKGSPIKLRGGAKGKTYWLSVVANCNFAGCGEWGWENNATITGNQGMFQNPNGGFGVCPTWGTIANCVGATDADFMFELQGTSR